LPEAKQLRALCIPGTSTFLNPPPPSGSHSSASMQRTFLGRLLFAGVPADQLAREEATADALRRHKIMEQAKGLRDYGIVSGRENRDVLMDKGALQILLTPVPGKERLAGTPPPLPDDQSNLVKSRLQRVGDLLRSQASISSFQGTDFVVYILAFC